MIINQVITGGGGSATSTIVVTAPTGSTVTLTNPRGTTTTGVEVSGTWTFSGLAIFGSYTVTATLDGKTSTQTVLVDVIGTFSTTITYKLYLYNLGDECSSVSGGWALASYKPSTLYTFATLTKNSDNLHICAGKGQYYGEIKTNNTIDLTNYTKLVFDVRNCSGTFNNNNKWGKYGVMSDHNPHPGVSNKTEDYTGLLETDISSVSESYAIGLYLSTTNGSVSDNIQIIKRVWLE